MGVTRCGGGSPAKLACVAGKHGKGSKIHIVKNSASWMRRSREICPDIPTDIAGDPLFRDINKCGNPGNAMRYVKEQCQGKRECTIEPNDDHTRCYGMPQDVQVPGGVIPVCMTP